MTELCLGTVQFGMNYGITNISGRVETAEVERILKIAYERGVRLIDTANAYGSAEKTLGSLLHGIGEWRIISKLPGEAGRHLYDDKLGMTMRSLNVEYLEGYLLHDSRDAGGCGHEELVKWIKGQKEEGRIRNIGVSIYSGEDLEGIDFIGDWDVIQLPVSIFDQRLVQNGVLSRLRGLGISIHARSIFLQELLLKDVSECQAVFLAACMSTLNVMSVICRMSLV